MFVYSYFCTLPPILELEISEDLSQVTFISTVRKLGIFFLLTCLHFFPGSVTIANGQIEWSQSTNFDKIQDGNDFNQAVFWT